MTPVQQLIAVPAEVPVPTSGELAEAGDPERSDVLAARLAAAEVRLAELTDLLSSNEVRLGERIDSASARLDELAAAQSVTAVELDRAGVLLQTSSLASADRIAALTAQLMPVDDRLNLLGDQSAAARQRLTEHDSALLEVRRSVAAEVQEQTTNALLDAQHRVQLAANSIARLALAMAESAADITEDLSAESATSLVDSFRVDLDGVLAQLGFESLGTAVGASFDPHQHRALRRVATLDQAADKKITRVIRDGYRSAATDRVLLFADVEVGRYQS